MLVTLQCVAVCNGSDRQQGLPMNESLSRPVSAACPIADWPVASTTLNGDGGSDWVLICEHASSYMPAEYDGLGLPENVRRSHVAWDPGAADLTRVLSQEIGATAILANYSRLLVDLNRPLESPALMPTRSETLDIPGNTTLTSFERERRINRIFHPFHTAVAALLDSRAAAGRRSRILALHSFTPTFDGRARPWHLGVLSGASRALADETVRRVVAEQPELSVALDEPYRVETGDDYTIPVHGDQRDCDALLLEVRNDTLSAPAAVNGWASTLARVLEDL